MTMILKSSCLRVIREQQNTHEKLMRSAKTQSFPTAVVNTSSFVLLVHVRLRKLTIEKKIRFSHFYLLSWIFWRFGKPRKKKYLYSIICDRYNLHNERKTKMKNFHEFRFFD